MGKMGIQIWSFANAPEEYRRLATDAGEAKLVVIGPEGERMVFEDMLSDILYTGYIEPDVHVQVGGMQVYITYE